MKLKQYEGNALKAYIAALCGQLKFARILSGSTKVQRSHDHLLINAPLSGGDKDVLLCQREFTTLRIVQDAYSTMHLCPFCQRRIAHIARLVANEHPQWLFDAASGKVGIITLEAKYLHVYLENFLPKLLQGEKIHA